MIYIKDGTKNKAKFFNKNNFYVVADFDHTLTDQRFASSWTVFHGSEILSSEFKEEAKALFNHYYPIELDETIGHREKFKLMDEWWHKEFSLYIKYGLHEKQIEEGLLLNPIVLRDGVKEWLENLNKNKIPVIIVSGGIGNIIETAFKQLGINHDNIYMLANFFEFENGIAKKLKGKMIHTLNKNEQHLPLNIKNKISDRPKVLLLGDKIGDATMTSAKDDDVLKIGFLDIKLENLPFYEKTFDIVATNNTSVKDLFEVEVLKKLQYSVFRIPAEIFLPQ